MKYNAEELVTFIVETVHISPIYKCESAFRNRAGSRFLPVSIISRDFLVINAIHLF